MTEPVDIKITCLECGKPLVNVNRHGMFCEDYCGLEESKQAEGKLSKLFDGLERLTIDGRAP